MQFEPDMWDESTIVADSNRLKRRFFREFFIKEQ
jgi:hypothetical protein